MNRLITPGNSFLSLDELMQVVALLMMVAGFLVIVGFRKVGFTMLGLVLVMAFLPILAPILNSLFPIAGSSERSSSFTGSTGVTSRNKASGILSQREACPEPRTFADEKKDFPDCVNTPVGPLTLDRNKCYVGSPEYNEKVRQFALLAFKGTSCVTYPYRGDFYEMIGNDDDHKYATHAGIDLRADNVPVYAIASGTVITRSFDIEEEHSTLIIQSDDKSQKMLYLHMREMMSAVEGETHVNRGDWIGTAGDIGIKDAPHLHVEVWPSNSLEYKREKAISGSACNRRCQDSNIAAYTTDPFVALGTVRVNGSGQYNRSLGISDAQNNALPDRLITRKSVGPVQIGMTVAQVRKALPNMKLVASMDGDNADLFEVKDGDTTVMLMYPEEVFEMRRTELAITDRSRIAVLLVCDKRYATIEGVHPGMFLRDVENTYGKLTKITMSEIESREEAEFARMPTGITLRVGGVNYAQAGIYLRGKRQTTQFYPDASVRCVAIDWRTASEISPVFGENSHVLLPPEFKAVLTGVSPAGNMQRWRKMSANTSGKLVTLPL